MLVGGVQRRGAGEDQRLHRRHSGRRQRCLDRLARRRPGALVGDHQHRTTVRAQRIADHLADPVEHSAADIDHVGLVGVGQTPFDRVVHGCLLLLVSHWTLRASIRSVSSCCKS